MRTDLEPLARWLADVMPVTGVPAGGDGRPVLTPLSGDAGARRYYRIEQAPERLAVYAPPGAEDSKTFAELAAFLRAQGIQAPRVYAADYQRGFLLIDNLGERLYLGDLDGGTVEALYGEALMTLLCLQQSPPPSPELPPYSRDRLIAEMDLFPQWFVTRLLDYPLNASESLLIKQVFNTLVENALTQPQCFVHRDFHSRNLIHREVGSPGVIDFQDAVWGPFTYDLVSLLRDCYIRWPRSHVERWALGYANMAREVGIAPADLSARQFLRWFDLMGLQRHLKVLGIFARLALRDNKPAYLADLPLVMRYLLEVLEDHAGFDQFTGWFKHTLLPRIREQDWYTDYTTAGYAPDIEAL